MTSGFRRGVRGLRREVKEVVVRSIWVEGGWRRRNDGGHGDGMTCMAATVAPASSSSTRGKKKGRARASEGKRARLSASTQGRKDARQQGEVLSSSMADTSRTRVAVRANPRARGGRRTGHGGRRFWAGSGPNQDMGRIRRSKPARSSTFSIKGAKSFEL